MTDRIGGVFPGGPSRADAARRRHAPIVGVEELARRQASGRTARARKERRRRVLVGAILATVFAGTWGFVMGRSADTDPREEQTAVGSRDALDRVISMEVSRTLLELWKMEDLERAAAGRPLP